MAYFTDVCSPETWGAYQKTDKLVAGFQEHQRSSAEEHVRPGDIFLCYLTCLSRWCGVLEVRSEAYDDFSPRPGYGTDDPFPVRFEVEPIVVLGYELAIPIKDDAVWNSLSFTTGRDKNRPYWTGTIRRSLNRINAYDGDCLVKLLKEQQASRKSYPLSSKDKVCLRGRKSR